MTSLSELQTELAGASETGSVNVVVVLGELAVGSGVALTRWILD